MFYESKFPKKDLKKIAERLVDFSERFLLYSNWLYELEKSTFLGFYFIRKLIESKTKVTTDLSTQTVSINTYKFVGKKRLFPPIGEEYNYNEAQKEKLKIIDVCNLFIHSQIFLVRKKDKGLKYIYITSDKYIYEKIFQIDIQNVIDIFSLTSKNNVMKIISYYDEKSNKVVTKSY